MGLFNKISCEIQILNEKVGKLMIENGKLKEELQQEIRAKESWRDLYREQLEKNKKLKEEYDNFKKKVSDDMKEIAKDQLENIGLFDKLEEENRKLKEFKAKQEEMMFLIGASIELAHPKTYRDSEKLQKGKEIYEKLYKEELYYLKEDNRNLKEKYDGLWEIYIREANELKKENKYRKNQIKELKEELRAKKELLRYYQKKS